MVKRLGAHRPGKCHCGANGKYKVGALEYCPGCYYSMFGEWRREQHKKGAKRETKMSKTQ